VPVEVILPKVDMDMSTGRISKWHVAEGQAVRQGELLFEIETDKAAMEIDAPAAGVIRDIVGEENVDIPVGRPVAWIYAEGEAYAPAVAVQSTVPASSGENSGNEGRSTLPPSGPPAISPTRGENSSGAVRATPLARRLARERGLDLSAVRGSGPRGRIVRADVEGAAITPSSPSSPVAENAPSLKLPISPLEGEMVGGPEEGAAAASSDRTLALFEPGSYELAPHDAMRRAIARRLVEAKATVPHFYLTAHCGIDALLRLRADLNATAPGRDGEPAWRLSVNDMVVKALAAALVKVPAANVSWTDEAMVRHRHVDVGIAVSVPGGLITPIVRRAEEKSLSAISNETKALAERARARALRPQEYRGGTTAVSNLGMFGVSEFAAIVNPPHATILAVGAGERRAVVDGDLIRAATMMTVTLSADHRAVDGALAAELLAAFRETIEHPLGLVA